jgi:hypothetical protein
MLVFFDTEFIDDAAGRSILPLSIGMIRADGREFYAELDADVSHASPWVRENILPTLVQPKRGSLVVAAEIRAFVGNDPEFWAHYAAYDWVVLCQMFGGLMQLPPGWPSYVRDLRCLMDDCGVWVNDQHDNQHHALSDARWVRETWLRLKGFRA